MSKWSILNTSILIDQVLIDDSLKAVYLIVTALLCKVISPILTVIDILIDEILLNLACYCINLAPECVKRLVYLLAASITWVTGDSAGEDVCLEDKV